MSKSCILYRKQIFLRSIFSPNLFVALEFSLNFSMWFCWNSIKPNLVSTVISANGLIDNAGLLKGDHNIFSSWSHHLTSLYLNMDGVFFLWMITVHDIDHLDHIVPPFECKSLIKCDTRDRNCRVGCFRYFSILKVGRLKGVMAVYDCGGPLAGLPLP